MRDTFIQALLDTLREPKQDLEKNVKALVAEHLNKLNIVSADEMAVQTRLLAEARAQLNALKQRIDELERHAVNHNGTLLHQSPLNTVDQNAHNDLKGMNSPFNP